MVSTLLLCSGMIVAAGPTDANRADYEAARVQAGRDPGAHVKLALWCEQHGMTAERAKHLALAVLTDPKNAMARGLMGLVQDRGAWRRPDDVSAKLKADAEREAKRAEYNEKRARAPHTADGQWKLALWCDENDLKAEARAHFTAVVRLDPRREAAWKRLGFKKQGNRWVTEAQLAAEKHEKALQEKADKHWKPLLEKWRSWLGEKGKHRDEAEQALLAITDPRAVPMVVAVFAPGSPERQAIAVRVLGQIDAAGASRALAMFAVFGKSPDVRRIASETLRRRDVREFADLLIALVRDPIKYEVKPVNGPGSQGELFVQGKQVNYKRLYSPPPAAQITPQQGDQLSVDAYGLPVLWRPNMFFATSWMPWQQALGPPPPPISPALSHTMAGIFQNAGAGANSQQLSAQFLALLNTNPLARIVEPSLMAQPPDNNTMFRFGVGGQAGIPVGQMMVEAQRSAAAAQQQLRNDVEALDTINRATAERNDRVLPILKAVSGQDFGPDRVAWENWWLDQVGFRKMPQLASDKTTIVEQVPLAYAPDPVMPVEVFALTGGYQRVSCFGKGTLVRTVAGAQAIETLLPGDLVLTQNLQTGALRYQPILAVHHNPPGKTFRVALGGETIVSSEFHRFWKAGAGWVMARDLKAGDALRTLGGIEPVSSIDAGKVEPVYNLDVADDADFFVGQRGALVHDNTLPDLRLAPFDATPTLAAALPAAN